MIKYLASAVTTEGGVTKTLIDTLTLPSGTKRIVGAWAYLGVIDTTAETASGIVELESVDTSIQPCQIPLSPGGNLTGGARQQDIKIFPLDCPTSGGSRVSGYLTLDMALTANPKARYGLVIEV